MEGIRPPGSPTRCRTPSAPPRSGPSQRSSLPPRPNLPLHRAGPRERPLPTT